MREIKFRAWDEERERMIYFEALRAVWFYQDGYRIQSDETEESAGDRDFIAHDDYRDKEPLVKLLEYTGLKDKNGVEIYEGDILEYPDLSKGVYLFKEQPKRRSVMKWHEQDAAFKIPGTGFRINTERVEVVGNIHENPELLETK